MSLLRDEISFSWRLDAAAAICRAAGAAAGRLSVWRAAGRACRGAEGGRSGRAGSEPKPTGESYENQSQKKQVIGCNFSPRCQRTLAALIAVPGSYPSLQAARSRAQEAGRVHGDRRVSYCRRPGSATISSLGGIGVPKAPLGHAGTEAIGEGPLDRYASQSRHPKCLTRWADPLADAKSEIWIRFIRMSIHCISWMKRGPYPKTLMKLCIIP